MNNAPASPKPSFFKIQLLENRFPALHGLRLLAILFVVQHHFHFPGLSDAFMAFRGRLWIGMDCFFVMSGFLIGFMLFYVLESKGMSALPRFYTRRFFRILPPYYAVLTVLFVIYMIIPANYVIVTPGSLLKEIFFLTNYPSARYMMHWSWSLSVEEHFYLLSPFFILGLLKLPVRWRIPVLITLFILPPVQRFIAAASVTGGKEFFRFIYAPTHMRYDSFIAGCLLAYVEKFHAQAVGKWVAKPWFVPLTGILGLGLLMASASPFPGFEGLNYKLVSVQIGTLTGLAYICLIFWALHAKGFLPQIMGAPPVRACATLGYSVYLTHIPIIVVFEQINKRWLHLSGELGFFLCFTLMFCVCLLAAYVLHILVEKPALLMRDKWTAPNPLKPA